MRVLPTVDVAPVCIAGWRAQPFLENEEPGHEGRLRRGDGGGRRYFVAGVPGTALPGPAPLRGLRLPAGRGGGLCARTGPAIRARAAVAASRDVRIPHLMGSGP